MKDELQSILDSEFFDTLITSGNPDTARILWEEKLRHIEDFGVRVEGWFGLEPAEGENIMIADSYMNYLYADYDDPSWYKEIPRKLISVPKDLAQKVLLFGRFP